MPLQSSDLPPPQIRKGELSNVKYVLLNYYFRHLQAAQALGVNTTNLRDEDAAKALVDRLLQIMSRLKVPNGLKALGFTENDIPELVQGTQSVIIIQSN